MLPSAGREESLAVQEGRGDEPPLRRVVCPCEQSALAIWLTNDRYTIHVGLRVGKRREGEHGMYYGRSPHLQHDPYSLRIQTRDDPQGTASASLLHAKP